MRRITASLAGLVLGGAPFAGAAGVGAGTTEFSVGADLLGFHYRERGRDGAELNEETGLLPGLRLTARGGGERVIWRADLALHDGRVDYDGETQAGAPFDSETEARLVTVSGELGGRWSGDSAGHWASFLRLAARQWDRDIQGRNGVQGLFETYRWLEVGGGVRRSWSGTGDAPWRHEAAALVFAVADGEIDVALSELDGSDLDDTTLDLGSDVGLRLRYRASRPIGGGRRLWIEPRYEYWEFGRSNTRAVTSNGAPVGLLVTEPASESQRIGIAIGLTF
jgi:hypothetical protein